jgi:hypothetical protein
VDPDPHQSEGNLRPLVYRSPPGLHFEHPGIHYERPRLYFEPLLNFYFNADADPDPAFHSNADPDPASKKMRVRIPAKKMYTIAKKKQKLRGSTLLLKHKRKGKKRSDFSI